MRRTPANLARKPLQLVNTSPDNAAPACGLIRRGLIMLYDLMPVVAIIFIAGLLALPFTPQGPRAGLDPFYTAYILGAWFLYLGLCWTRAGQTLGMRAWKIEILTDAGERPGWGASAIRFLASFLSLAPLGLGFWSSALRSDRACWHDRISGTQLRRKEPGAS